MHVLSKICCRTHWETRTKIVFVLFRGHTGNSIIHFPILYQPPGRFFCIGRVPALASQVDLRQHRPASKIQKKLHPSVDAHRSPHEDTGSFIRVRRLQDQTTRNLSSHYCVPSKLPNGKARGGTESSLKRAHWGGAAVNAGAIPSRFFHPWDRARRPLSLCWVSIGNFFPVPTVFPSDSCTRRRFFALLRSEPNRINTSSVQQVTLWSTYRCGTC